MSKLKLNPTGHPLMRLGEPKPTLSLAPLSATRAPQLPFLESKRLEHQIKRAQARVISQQIDDEAEAQIHVNRLVVHSKVVVAGELIALEAATTRQSITAECTRATAEGVERLEDERFSRTQKGVLKHQEKERELDELTAAGKLNSDYAEFLKAESLDRTKVLIERDKALTREIADHVYGFSLIAAAGFKSSVPEGGTER
mgnify:CR=1 FL=1